MKLELAREKYRLIRHTLEDLNDETQHLQSRLAAIVDSSNDAIIGKDLNGIVTTWNRGAEQLFGYTAQEMIGRPIRSIIPTDHSADFTQILETIKRGERVEHFETERITKDGRRVPVSLSVSPIRDAAGKIIGASKIARDITKQKKLEESLKRALKLREEFISIASHELKTPLTSLKLQMEVRRRSLKKGDATVLEAERVTKFIEGMERQLDRLHQLVNDMLESSRIGAGKMVLSSHSMDLSTLVREVVESLEDHFKACNCDVHLELDNEVVGSWDRNRLEQVVINLLTNATRYAPGKPVTVRTRLEKDQAMLEVADQGIGIAPKDQQRIFERFERVGSRNHGSGFGIGLYIVNEIVNAHGGHIKVDSALEQGAKFTIMLPRE